jgi:hypothetical protein
MDSDAEMAERHGRLLGRFAELAASLAEDLHACALAAETPEAKQALALAFHRTGRTLRQALALEARLRRDRNGEARLDAQRAGEVAKAALAARKSRVRAGVERLIWTEAEGDEEEGLLTLLAERLEYEDLDDPDEPVDALVARIAAEIGLEVPREGAVDSPDRAPSAAPGEGGAAGRCAPACAPAPSSAAALAVSHPSAAESDDYWPSG